MTSELKAFAQAVAKRGLTETGSAIALMWFLDQSGEASEVTPARLAQLLHDLSLRGNVNISRLTKNLRRNPAVMRGSQAGTVKLKLAVKPKLTTHYGPFTNIVEPHVDPHLISPEDVGARRYLQAFVTQINGSYQFGFYDACAVLCRRLMETLLIEAFEHKGHGASIKQGSDYRPLSDLIGIAVSGHHIKLNRNSGSTMEKIKGVGDTAAHHRTYVTKQRDIDDLKHEFRRLISELANIAGITPTT